MKKSSLIEFILILAAMIIAITGCSKDEAEVRNEAEILAEGKGFVITVTDFEDELERREKSGRPIPGKEILLQEMVTRAAALNRAREVGLGENAGVRRKLENVLIGQLRDRELQPLLRSVHVGEEELRERYEAESARFHTPAMARFAVLLVKKPKVMSETKRAALRDRIGEARQEIIANPPQRGRGPATMGFGTIAIDYSEDQASRYRGGDIGWVKKDRSGSRWPDEILSAGFSQAVDEVSEVIESESGFYLVIKTDERERRVTPFEDVRVSLRQNLQEEKRAQLTAEFAEENERLAAVKINSAALAGVRLPASSEDFEKEQDAPPALPTTNKISRR